jgi:hypothetical protein
MNTGTNVTEKLVKSQGCEVMTNNTSRGENSWPWKHKLLDKEDLRRVENDKGDTIISTTRGPYCWARSMIKAPYHVRNPSTNGAWVVDREPHSWRAENLGEAWNKYMLSVSDFHDRASDHPSITSTILPYEALISDGGLDAFKSALPVARNMTQQEFETVMSSPAKSHGKPRTLADAKKATGTECKDELWPEQIEQLRATVDHGLAAKFGYEL